MVMRIAEQRQAAELSQQQLASSMGVAQSAVSSWEAEVYLPRTRQLPLLARVLDCSIDELFAPEEADPPMEQYII